MAVPEKISNVFHNYKSELESLEQKFGWFQKEQISIRDIFEQPDITKSLRTDLNVPAYLVDQIEIIRRWYEEKKGYWESLPDPD